MDITSGSIGLKKAEGRRQKAEGRRKNCLWIVNDQPLRAYKPQTILTTPLITVSVAPPEEAI
ncbi:MAG: hypothetical protein SWX82_01745 [Cyanobacteriota bacterium]|nr:hypothetical protein [Cyanobacteriota bacterium]